MQKPTVAVRVACETYKEELLVAITTRLSLVAREREINLAEIGIDVEELGERAKKVWKVDILPKAFLDPLEKIRTKIRSACSASCAVTDLGYITTRDRAVKLIESLKVYQTEFYTHLSEISEEKYYKQVECALENIKHDALARELGSKHVNVLIEHVSQSGIEFNDFINNRNFQFTALPIHLDPEQFDPQLYEAQRDGMVLIRENVMGGLIREISEKANKIFQSLTEQCSKRDDNKWVINSKTLKSFVELQEKVNDLSFVHPHLGTVGRAIENELSRLRSRSAALRGAEFDVFRTLASALSNQHRLISCLDNNLPIIYVEEKSRTVKAKRNEEKAAKNPDAAIGNVIKPTASDRPQLLLM